MAGLDTKHIISSVLGLALGALLTFLGSKGIQVSCPQSAPAAPVSQSAQ